jgi:hypothetical protein
LITAGAGLGGAIVGGGVLGLPLVGKLVGVTCTGVAAVQPEQSSRVESIAPSPLLRHERMGLL